MTAEQIVKILEVTEKEGDIYSSNDRKKILYALNRNLPLATMSQQDFLDMLDTIWLERILMTYTNLKEPNLSSGIKLIRAEVQAMHI